MLGRYIQSLYILYSIFDKLVQYKNMIDDIIEIDQYLLRHKKVHRSQICQNTEVVAERNSTFNEVLNENFKEDFNDS